MRTRHLALLFALPSAVLTVASPAGAHPSSAAAATSVTVVAGKPSEFKFAVLPKTLPHGAVIFNFSVAPTASLPHDFKICSSPKGSLTANACVGKATTTISPGAKTTLSFTFKTKGTYEYICTIPGHAAAGMKGLLKVT